MSGVSIVITRGLNSEHTEISAAKRTQDDFDLACLAMEASAPKKRSYDGGFCRGDAFRLIEEAFQIPLSKSNKNKFSLSPAAYENKKGSRKRFSYLEMYQEILGDILSLSESPVLRSSFGKYDQTGLNRESSRRRLSQPDNISYAKLFIRNGKF